MQRAAIIVVYTALALLVAVVAANIITGREPSAAILTLLGSLLGGVWAERVLSRDRAKEAAREGPELPAPVEEVKPDERGR